MDKSGVIFIVLLCAMVATVLGILLLETGEPVVPPGEGSLLPPEVPGR